MIFATSRDDTAHGEHERELVLLAPFSDSDHPLFETTETIATNTTHTH